MAPIESSPNTRALAGWPNALAGLYVLLLFLALRVLDDSAQLGALVAAAIVFAAMLVGRVLGQLSANAEGKKLVLFVGLPANALLLVGGALSAWFILGDAPAGGMNALVAGAGVLLVVAGACITLALELVCGPMRATGVIDNRRVNAAARTAATLVAAVAGLAGLGYGVEKLDLRRDFSFAAPTSPSAATVSMLEAGACGDEKGKPEVFLFFERGNTAVAEVRDYFDGLEQKGARVTMLDAALDPVLAKSMKVSKNGTVGFRCGARTESWTLGDDREDAQKKIKKLDEEVRTRLARITRDPANVYVTVGHGERSLEEAAKGADRVSAKGLKKLIEGVNGKVKKLGLAEGLTREVPRDAALVVIPGPSSAFLTDEATALADYVKGGGSLLLLLDPVVPGGVDVAASLAPLTEALGVRVGTQEALNDKNFVKNTGTAADHAFLFSTSFGSHKSVKTLSGARGKEAVLFLSATSVTKVDKPESGARVSMLARTPVQSFIDVNADRAYQQETEARAVIDLAAAVELPGATEGRAVVVGDSEIMSDLLLAQHANPRFAYETLLWLLRDDDKLGGAVVSEEDVPIKHTRDEDKLWFYLTIFLGPVLCFGGGLGFVSMKRRRRSSQRSARATSPASAPRSEGGAQ